MGERGVRNAEVEGSNPLPSTMKIRSEEPRTSGSSASSRRPSWTPVDAGQRPSTESTSTRCSPAKMP